jgi:lipopolysaccharide biosynthesis protein
MEQKLRGNRTLLRFIRNASLLLATKAILGLQLTLGHVRRLRSQIRSSSDGADPIKSSADHAVYVHYDADGVIHDYVFEQLKQLVLANFRVTFVSNAPSISERDLESIRPYCRILILRRNVGYDFGAYKDGLASIDSLADCRSLLIMNDSVYGPLRPLSGILNNANDENVDVWGITDSWEVAYHIQSYFVVFYHRSLKSAAFRDFWQKLPYVNDKRWVIENAEVKLTQLLVRQKLKASVLCPYWTVASTVLAKLDSTERRARPHAHQTFCDELESNLITGHPMNQSYFFWDTLISDFGSPFMKREIMAKNKREVLQAWRWTNLIKSVSSYDPGLVWRHLHAFLR